MGKRTWCLTVALGLMLGCACEEEPEIDGGPIELDAGRFDAGQGFVDDASLPPCNSVGRSGGLCRTGTQCVTGLHCYGTNLRPALTLGLLGIAEGMEDPANPGEYLAGEPSTIPIGVAPGGLCTEGCSTAAEMDTCGECSFCNDAIGGPRSFARVGIDVGLFDADDVIGAAEDGVCRARCDFDPETDGGCPEGYTCDLLTNTCLERCLSDDQCNLEFGVSLAVGLVATRAPGEPFTCDTTTGRCAHDTPPGAALGSACERDADCEAVHGFCFAGHCSRGHCADAEGQLAGGTATCAPDGTQCLSFGGNGGTACVGLCDTADDCFADQACDPVTTPIPDGNGRMWAGVCVLPCSDDTECQTDRVCDRSLQRFRDASLGICAPYCDPGGTGIAGAVSCEVPDEACVAIESDAQGRGVCRPQDGICAVHEACFAGQACRVDGASLNGRCEDGCADDADCDAMAGEECVKVDTDPDDGAPQALGVCVAPDGACSPSPRATDGSPLRLLRGLDGSAQCVSSQRCDAPLDDSGMPMVDAMGTCVDRP